MDIREGLVERGDGFPVAGVGRRSWIMVLFHCCWTYSRVYRNPEGSKYIGRCPRCGKRVTARVGPEGTARRMFEAM